MTVSAARVNAEQYSLLGRDPPGLRLELVDGEIVVSPSPNPEHSRAVYQLTLLIGNYVEEHELGEVLLDVDTVFGEFDVRRPDILFFRRARRGLIGQKKLAGKPDLAVEVVSPTSDRTDKVEKFRQYAKGGVKFYWIVDPAQEAFEAYALKSGRYVLVGRGEGDDVIHAEPFVELAIPLKKLWWRR